MTFRNNAVLLVNLALEVMRRRAIWRQPAIRAIEWRGGDPYLAVYVVGQGRQQVGLAVRRGQRRQQQQAPTQRDVRQQGLAKDWISEQRDGVGRPGFGVTHGQQLHPRAPSAAAARLIASTSHAG